jgi:hypothetical protein
MGRPHYRSGRCGKKRISSAPEIEPPLPYGQDTSLVAILTELPRFPLLANVNVLNRVVLLLLLLLY